jgi:DNA-binding NarL/FixJ family response regulator
MKSGGKPNGGPQGRVLLVDRDPAFARRLAEIFGVAGPFCLCSHVPDATAALAAISMEKPDLVLVDCEADSAAALQLIRTLAGTHPERRVLGLSRRGDPAEAEQMFISGARGVLLRSDPPEEILGAFRTVLKGLLHVSRPLTAPLLQRLLAQSAKSATSGLEGLTDREFRIFELLGLGLSTRDIAARLGLSCKTVDSHRAKIQHRLGLKNAADLSRSACVRQLGSS